MKKITLCFFCLIFCFTGKAQNWSPFRLDVPNYFLHPDYVSGIEWTQECLGLRFDTVLQTSPLPTYRKKWTGPPEFSGQNQKSLYRPWHYFGTIFTSDTAKGIYQLSGDAIDEIGPFDTVYFQPSYIAFYKPHHSGDTVLKASGFIGILESKTDSTIENQLDSVATIRLHGVQFDGRIIILSKNQGLLELPSFSAAEGGSTLHRHFEGPGKWFDFKAGNQPHWAPGDELHFVSSAYQNYPGSILGPPRITTYYEKRIVRCTGNGSGGLVFTGIFSSTSSTQINTSPAVVTIITDSIYSLPYPPGGIGDFQSQTDTFSINQYTQGKTSALFSSPVSCSVLPGNLAVKFYYHVVVDAAFIPLQSYPPFSGGTLGSFGFMFPGESSSYSYPVFYRFGNDSAGVPLPDPTGVRNKLTSSLSVFPNPASQSCYIHSDSGPVEEVRIIDLKGLKKALQFDPVLRQVDSCRLIFT